MSKRDSLDLDDQLAPKSNAGNKHQVDRAERKRIAPSTDSLAEYTGDIGREMEQHPGRLEGGHETVLRPQQAVDQPQTNHRRAERRAQLLLAAHAARIASAQVSMLAPVKRSLAKQEGERGLARAIDHLQIALQLADPVQSADLDAVADAVINCDNLVDSLDRIENKRSDNARLLSRLVGALQRDTGYRPSHHGDVRPANQRTRRTR